MARRLTNSPDFDKQTAGLDQYAGRDGVTRFRKRKNINAPVYIGKGVPSDIKAIRAKEPSRKYGVARRMNAVANYRQMRPRADAVRMANDIRASRRRGSAENQAYSAMKKKRARAYEERMAKKRSEARDMRRRVNSETHDQIRTMQKRVSRISDSRATDARRSMARGRPARDALVKRIRAGERYRQGRQSLTNYINKRRARISNRFSKTPNVTPAQRTVGSNALSGYLNRRKASRMRTARPSVLPRGI